MKVSQIITAKKSGVTWAAWSNTKPRRPDFPMSRKKGGSFPLTRKWRWATVKFSALSCDFVVLVAYHSEVPEYQAVLAEKLHNDTRTLSRYEYHGNHPVVGWHLHACCGDISDLETGITKPSGQKRIPQAHNRHRSSVLTSDQDSMSDTLAMKIAAIRYGLPYQEDLLGYQFK